MPDETLDNDGKKADPRTTFKIDTDSLLMAEAASDVDPSTRDRAEFIRAAIRNHVNLFLVTRPDLRDEYESRLSERRREKEERRGTQG